MTYLSLKSEFVRYSEDKLKDWSQLTDLKLIPEIELRIFLFALQEDDKFNGEDGSDFFLS